VFCKPCKMEELKVTCLFYVLVLFVSCVSCEESEKNGLFSDILKPSDACVESCDKTYPLHTYPSTENAEACYRGCRLYAITEFVDDKSPLADCKDSCKEAYNKKNETQFACVTGCNCQDPVSKSKKTQEQSSLSPAEGGNVFMLEIPSFPSLFEDNNWSGMFGKPDSQMFGKPEENSEKPMDMGTLMDNFFGKPMSKMSNMMGSLKDHASRITSYSYSFYMGKDANGKTVVIESPPQIKTQLIMDPQHDVDTHNLADTEQMMAALDNVLNMDKQQEDSAPAQPDKLVEHKAGTVDVHGWDWLGCISDRSGLPRWFLVGTVFLSVLAFVWLCFATHATAPDHHTKGTAASSGDKNDLQYMQFVDLYEDDYALADKCPLIDTADVHQAAPLPIKMDIKTV